MKPKGIQLSGRSPTTRVPNAQISPTASQKQRSRRDSVLNNNKNQIDMQDIGRTKKFALEVEQICGALNINIEIDDQLMIQAIRTVDHLLM